ncbi:DUF2723 domain-containing protein, partial [Candidatus Poribacteria bacterium]|nr:DUF2723 domain-containing protein [Candidatus Poribacteria bacterium]
MTTRHGLTRFLSAFLIFFVTFAVYIYTLCPTVYWGDSGELIAAAYTLGIPHPPGHPLYSIVGKLFTLLPVGSVAYRVNLMSAFFGALTCLLIYKIIRGQVYTFDIKHSINGPQRKPMPYVKCVDLTPVCAFGGALFFAFAPMVWDQATIAETTTFHSFFMMLLTLIAFRLVSGKVVWKDERRSLLLFSFLYGFSLTNHVAGVFFFPAFVYLFLFSFGKRILAPRLFFSMLFVSFSGLLVYGYLPLRSLANPPIDWGNPENLRNFLWVVTARQFSPNVVSTPNPVKIIGHLILSGKDLLHQFTIAGCALGITGAWTLARREGRVVVFGLIVVAILFYIGLNSAFISAYFVPALALMAIWIGVGLQQAFKWVIAVSDRIRAESSAKVLRYGVCGALGVSFILPFGLNFRKMNRSEDIYALRYGEQILERLPRDSALFTLDGNALFILWYLKYCEYRRPDLMVIEPTWITAGIPLHSQVMEQYPELVLPPSETVEDYKQRGADTETRKYLAIQAIMDANYDRRPIFWGIIMKGLPFFKNLDPQGIICRYSNTPLALSEETVADNKDFWDSELQLFLNNSRLKNAPLALEIYPVELNNQSLMFEDLGRDDLSRWAVELALKFNPEYPISRYNLGRLEDRAGRHSDAIREYKHAIAGNPYMALAYYGLGNAYRSTGQYADAFLAYRKAVRLYPNYHEAMTAMGQLYSLVGQHDDAVEQFRRALKIKPTYVFALRGLANAYLQLNRLDDASEVLNKALESEPDSPLALFMLAKYCARTGDRGKAASALRRSIEMGGDAYLV